MIRRYYTDIFRKHQSSIVTSAVAATSCDNAVFSSTIVTTTFVKNKTLILFQARTVSSCYLIKINRQLKTSDPVDSAKSHIIQGKQRQRFLATKIPTPETSHQLYKEQLIELQKEREEMFGFSDEEKQAWASNSNSGTMTTTTNDTDQTLLSMEQWLVQQQQENHDPPVDDSISSTCARSNTTNATTTITSNNDQKMLSHVSVDGKSIEMVNVGPKEYTKRTATAQTNVLFPQEVMDALFYNNNNKNTSTTATANELMSPKGPIFATAKIAGIMGCKRTFDLIPLCHPIPIDHIDITIQLDVLTRMVTITCTCTVYNAKTGIEMEALTGCTIAALTIYDMTKAVSHNIRITDTKLLSKTGGKKTILNTNTDK